MLRASCSCARTPQGPRRVRDSVGERLAQRPALRDGRSERRLEPLSRRHEHRERLDGRYRHDPDRQVQIGDTAAKTWVGNFDDVSLT